MSVIIRDVNLEDVERLLEIYEYYVEHTAITFEYVTPSKQEFAERIKNITTKYPYFVIEQDGVIQGYAYAGVFKGRAAYDWACEMTIYLDKNVQKKGLGRALYEHLEEALKKMGMTNLYACIGSPEVEDEYLTNNSENFHAHIGYQKIGEFHKCGYKFDRWYHMIWMEKIVNEHVEKQAPIIPWGKVEK